MPSATKRRSGEVLRPRAGRASKAVDERRAAAGLPCQRKHEVAEELLLTATAIRDPDAVRNGTVACSRLHHSVHSRRSKSIYTQGATTATAFGTGCRYRAQYRAWYSWIELSGSGSTDVYSDSNSDACMVLWTILWSGRVDTVPVMCLATAVVPCIACGAVRAKRKKWGSASGKCGLAGHARSCQDTECASCDCTVRGTISLCPLVLFFCVFSRRRDGRGHVYETRETRTVRVAVACVGVPCGARFSFTFFDSERGGYLLDT